GKHPIPKWKALQNRRLTREEVEIYWITFPYANIGAVTGPDSGIITLDVDLKEGVDGNTTIAEHRAAGYDVPATFTDARGDGLHLHYRYPDGYTDEQKAQLRNVQDEKLGGGLDIRAGGGQVVLAPSMHYSGERRRVVDSRPPVPVPQWIADLLLKAKERPTPQDRGTRTVSAILAEGIGLPPQQRSKLIEGYVRKHYAEGIGAGNRHNAFKSISGLMWSTGADEPEIRYFLRDFNQKYCRPPKPDIDGEITALLDFLAEKKHPDTTLAAFAWEGKHGVIHLEHQAIAEHLHEMFHTVSFKLAKTIYIYRDGTYRPDAGELGEEISRIIQKVGFKGSVTHEARDILFILSHINYQAEYPFNKVGDVIPVSNGVLHIDFTTGAVDLLPHDPGYMFTFKLPIAYDSTADGETFHKDVLSKYVSDDHADADEHDDTTDPTDILYQIPAQALLQFIGSKPYKKSYIIQGDYGGGKTTYLEWLTRLFGAENISHVSLHQIGNDRFVNAKFEGKIVNAYDELADVPLENIGPFKALTGGYDHDIEKKCQSSYQGRISTVHVFSCNSPPDVPEKVIYDPAFWTRWEYIHFSNVFEVDTSFNDRYFTDEHMSGSFNRIIQMMIKIRRGGLVADSSPMAVKETWHLAADPFKRFIAEHTIDTTDVHTFPKGPLLEKFAAFCMDNKVNERKIPTSTKAFTAIVFKNGFTEAQRVYAGRKQWLYIAHRSWKPESKYRISEDAVRANDAGTLRV
ncbi:MAG: hypothetical protein EHJ95_00280, partial [Methanobacteriota archaeon]